MFKTLETFGNCQRPVFTWYISTYAYKITTLERVSATLTRNMFELWLLVERVRLNRCSDQTVTDLLARLGLVLRWRTLKTNGKRTGIILKMKYFEA